MYHLVYKICSIVMALFLLTGLDLAAEEKKKKKKGSKPKPSPMTFEEVQAGMKETVGKQSGQGDFIFTYDHDLTSVFSFSDDPEKNLALQRSLHGGFAVDRRKGKGELYFFVPKVGIVRVSADLKSKKIINDSPEIKDKQKFHNCSIFYDHEDKGYLAFPGNKTAVVYITDLDGKVIHRLKEPKHNAYFQEGGNFSPTDTAFANGVLYVATGYSKGDYIITADPFKGKWTKQYFGGKGKGDGQFQTGHGITTHHHSKTLHVADRMSSRGQSFDFSGNFQDKYGLSRGDRPCDIDFHPDDPSLSLVGCLNGPIYVLKDQRVVSKVQAKVELNIPQSQKIHNAIFHVIDGKTYIIAQSWAPGSIFVLKQI